MSRASRAEAILAIDAQVGIMQSNRLEMEKILHKCGLSSTVFCEDRLRDILLMLVNFNSNVKGAGDAEEQDD